MKSDTLIEIDHVTFGYDASRTILNDVTLRFARGKVTAILGGSGCGKTTLLRLIGGMLRANARPGASSTARRVDCARPRRSCYALRRRMGMLFQFGALFTDLSVFDNVAFPLREHTDLPESMIRDIVLMKLNAVGLRGAASLRISEVSGGMARRIALARAIALDPELIMYDEPFAGLDLISMGVAANLIRTLNDATGATSLVVSHDVPECMAISDYVVPDGRAGGRIVAQGTPAELMALRPIPRCASSCAASPTVRCKFHYPAPPLAEDFGVPRARMNAAAALLGARDARRGVARRSGHAAYLLRRPAARACRRRCAASAWWSRRSTRSATVSLLIILASGMAVGFVLALQMYYALVHLRRHRVARADRQPVAGARARAGGHRAAVRRPRRHLAHRRDRPDEGRRAARGDGDDGDRPASARAGAALHRRHRRRCRCSRSCFPPSASSAPTSSRCC